MSATILDKSALSLRPASGEPSSDGESSSRMTLSVDPELPGRLEHGAFLQRAPKHDTLSEATTSPIFTSALWASSKQLMESDKSSNGSSGDSEPFTQYSLLARDLDVNSDEDDPRIFYNVAVPSSIFVCGSQGSGKSHTLSCILEGCLSESKINKLPHPLTGLLFHYDPFASEFGGSPCEAAYLALKSDIKVRVLCAPTNSKVIKDTYRKIPNVTVESLQIDQSDLNTRRMRDLMAIDDSNVPLYQHVVEKVLREMRLEQQQQPGLKQAFDYGGFKRRIENEELTPGQLNPLNQRLGTLESFMDKAQTNPYLQRNEASVNGWKGTNWDDVAGQLTIVDLSCPCVGADIACSLFNICLFLFLQMKDPDVLSAANAEELIKPQRMGRIVALDEAHKYMTADAVNSPECRTLTDSLLHITRMQRHLGVRVVISTQEPTISPKLLDLCSITIVHRFTSPAWMTALRAHLAGGDGRCKKNGKVDDGEGDGSTEDLFNQIISLKVGEALMFAPGAIVGLEEKQSKGNGGGPCRSGGKADLEVRRLGAQVLNVRIRQRVTADGRVTLMAR